jgi:hypothetical protein
MLKTEQLLAFVAKGLSYFIVKLLPLTLFSFLLLSAFMTRTEAETETGAKSRT